MHWWAISGQPSGNWENEWFHPARDLGWSAPHSFPGESAENECEECFAVRVFIIVATNSLFQIFPAIIFLPIWFLYWQIFFLDSYFFYLYVLQLSSCLFCHCFTELLLVPQGTMQWIPITTPINTFVQNCHTLQNCFFLDQFSLEMRLSVWAPS